MDSLRFMRRALSGYSNACKDIRYIKKYMLFKRSFLDGISGITKDIYVFHLRDCKGRNFDFCVFLRMCSGSGGRVGPGKLAGMTTA